MLSLILASLPLAIVAATPLLLAVEGELVVQRSGMINLGVEGMMLAAAFGATVAASSSSSIAAGVIGGIAASAFIAVLFGVFAITLNADQIVTGTAINLLALGVTGFAYRELTARGAAAGAPQMKLDFVTPLAWLIVPVALALFLWNTIAGLRLRASGENPVAMSAARLSTAHYRWLALGLEALLVGLAGAHLALSLSDGFAENMTAGRGFIALSVVIFGRWSVRGSLAGTALFGVAAALQYSVQAASKGVPFHLLLATPYVVTLLILCGVAGRVRAPEALGKRM